MTARPLILVGEADRGLRDQLRRRLEADGWAVAEAATGVEVLSRAVERQPDAVLLECMLPKMGGIAVADVLWHRYGAALPIVVVSANPSALDHARRLGAVAHLDKPLDPDQVSRTLKRAASHLIDRLRPAAPILTYPTAAPVLTLPVSAEPVELRRRAHS